MIVVDTNTVSELMKSTPSPVVVDWVRRHRPDEFFTTTVTLAEIRYGIARLTEGRRRASLAAVADEIFGQFAERVLSFDVDAARHYGEVVTHRERAGAPISGFDAQIASVCRSRGASLATRNVKDFEDTGVVVLDPWCVPQ